MNDATLTRTHAVSLVLPVQLLTPEAPLTGLALTREGVLTICAGTTGLAVQLGAEELHWLGQVAGAYATGLELQAAADARSIAPGQVGHA